MQIADLVAGRHFDSVAPYDINIFAYGGHRAMTYVGGFDVGPASVAERRNVYESV